MSNIRTRLKTIPEPLPNTRKVLEINLPEIVFFIGNGKINFLCGKCDATLADSVDDGILGSMVLKCNKCQSFNDIPYKKSNK